MRMYTHGIARIPAEPKRAADTGPTAWPVAAERIARQERRQMRSHRDRTDARAAAAVRDAERLVQVEVADVGAELARLGEPDQRVEVGAVDVHLAAGVVHDRAQIRRCSVSNTPCVDG